MVLIAIVDSSREDTQALERLVKDCLDEKGVPCLVHRFDNGIDLIRSRTVYDLVFMDITLDGMSGLDAAHFLRIVNKEAALVFVTHMVQMAIRGYEVGAVDFIAKPASRPVIDRAVNRVLRKLVSSRNDCFPVKTADYIVWLPADSIYYVEIYDHDLVYHTARGDHRVRGRFKEARERLEGQSFIQCNRSNLVNMRHVQSLHSDHLMVNGVRIPVARSHYREVRQTFLNCADRRA